MSDSNTGGQHAKTTAQAAEYLGVCKGTIKYHLYLQHIAAVQANRTNYFTTAALDALVESGHIRAKRIAPKDVP